MPHSAVDLLLAARNPDGGFPPIAGAASEAEPTALAAIALDDDAARRWLTDHQRGDGAFILGPPALENDSATPLAAVALGAGTARERALDYLTGHRAQALDNDPRFPHDPTTRGWGWTALTFGWVEPTAHGLLALRLLRPAAIEAIDDARRVLADRECAGGGWNYGNREVLGTDLEPYLQTTAAAVLALQRDANPELADRAIAVLERLWPGERGGLGLAMAAAALRASGHADAKVEASLETMVEGTSLLGSCTALGWAAIALGAGLQRLTVRP